MKLSEAAKAAYRKLLERDHLNILSLSRSTGVNYATANRLAQPKADFSNIPLSTIERLFPELKIYFFRDEYPAAASKGSPRSEADTVDLRNLRRKLKESNKFTQEERLKILDFLDEDI